MTKISVPFKIKDVFLGFAETHGVLCYEDGVLKIEFQTKDAVIGALKSDVQDLSVPISDIEDADLKRGMFGNKLKIQLSTLGPSAQVPGQETGAGEIVVHVEKKAVETALNFVSQLKLEVADHKLREAEASRL